MQSHQLSNSPQPFIAKPTDDRFIRWLAEVLSNLISLNPPKHDRKNTITRFHGVTPPTIGVVEYLERIAKYFRCSNECFVLSLVYIDRIVKLHDGFAVSILNIHRLLITSIMLAAKFFDDVYFSNSFYARVGGVETNEINLMEAQFLSLINYKLFVSPEEYDQYRQNVEDAVRPVTSHTLNTLTPLGLHINSEQNDINKNNQQYAVRGVIPHRKHQPPIRHTNSPKSNPHKRNGTNRITENYTIPPPHLNKNPLVAKNMIDHQAYRMKHEDETIPNAYFGRSSDCIRMSRPHPTYFPGTYPCDTYIQSVQDPSLIVDHTDERHRDHLGRNGVPYR